MGTKSVKPSQSLRKKIESVMVAGGKAPFPYLAAALYPVSLVYGAGQKLRAFGYRRNMMPTRRLPCRVICVGNITVGGTGKTPMTIFLARNIKQLGYRVAVVSRGYGGRAENRGGIVSDGKAICMGPEQAGDEPYLIACALKDIPVLVGKNRYASGMLALEQFQPDVIVLDDGFQHLGLQRDIDLVLLDCALPFGNTHLLPRGTLREPATALTRSTACILTRCRTGAHETAVSAIDLIKNHAPQSQVFTSSHEPYWYPFKAREVISINGAVQRPPPEASQQLKKEPVFAFSGIARNAEFQATVKQLGFDVGGFLEFADHHRYTALDFETIQSQATAAGARRLVTTEKDLVRLSPQNPFHLELIVIGVKISFGNHREPFMSFLKKQLTL